ncbi:MAG: ATP-binding protein [Gordonibacter sp.]|jgi:DNA replication protein DnaC
MLDPETKRKIRELGVPGMLDVTEMLCDDPSYAGLSFEEKARVAVDYMYQEAANNKVARLIRNAKLRFPQADITNIDYDGRPIKRELINDLGTTHFVASSTDIILEGFTGTGKSHLACAIAKQACKNCVRTLYIRMPDLLGYRAEKMNAGWTEKRILNKYAGYKVLVIDEFLIDKPTTDQMHFLLELTELRYDKSSTIFCTQYPNDEWHRRMGGGAHAESVIDRIVHNAVTIEMGDVNMRERCSKKMSARE